MIPIERGSEPFAVAPGYNRADRFNRQGISYRSDDIAGVESGAAARLLPLVYDQLRSLAKVRLARLGPDQTLTPTELVHETYLRVAAGPRETFEGRRHFFFAASRAMRDIMVESARRKATLKRGGSYDLVPAAADAVAIAPPHDRLLDLDRALRKLERESRERAQVVLLSYFGGLTHPEIAAVLGLSLATVERRWSYSRAWLRRELSASAPARNGGRRGSDC
jgi:RNA polymerase sigma factor (TIGR02999 family)